MVGGSFAGSETHLHIIFCGYNIIKKVFIFQIEKNFQDFWDWIFWSVRYLVGNAPSGVWKEIATWYLSSSKTWKFRISKSPALMRKFTNLANDKYLTNTGWFSRIRDYLLKRSLSFIIFPRSVHLNKASDCSLANLTPPIYLASSLTKTVTSLISKFGSKSFSSSFHRVLMLCHILSSREQKECDLLPCLALGIRMQYSNLWAFFVGRIYFSFQTSSDR